MTTPAHPAGRDAAPERDPRLLQVDGARPWLSIVSPHLPFYTPMQRLALVGIAADTYEGRETSAPGHDRLAAFTSLSLADLSSAIGGLLLPRDRAPYSTPALRRVTRGGNGSRTTYRLTLPTLEAHHSIIVDSERPAAGMLCLLPRYELTLSARLVLTVLTLLSPDGSTVEASNRRLAVLCGLTRETVILAVAQLCSEVPPSAGEGTPGGRPPLLELVAPAVGQRPARYHLAVVPHVMGGA